MSGISSGPAPAVLFLKPVEREEFVRFVDAVDGGRNTQHVVEQAGVDRFEVLHAAAECARVSEV